MRSAETSIEFPPFPGSSGIELLLGICEQSSDGPHAPPSVGPGTPGIVGALQGSPEGNLATLPGGPQAPPNVSTSGVQGTSVQSPLSTTLPGPNSGAGMRTQGSFPPELPDGCDGIAVPGDDLELPQLGSRESLQSPYIIGLPEEEELESLELSEDDLELPQPGFRESLQSPYIIGLPEEEELESLETV